MNMKWKVKDREEEAEAIQITDFKIIVTITHTILSDTESINYQMRKERLLVTRRDVRFIKDSSVESRLTVPFQ